MLNKQRIESIINEHLSNTDLFLVDLKVSSRNQIGVFIDGDHGVPISKCVELSRHIESQFDREKEDFELEVSSVGIDRPLASPRQFIKNVGREIIYQTLDGIKVKAKILSATTDAVTIEKELPKKKKKNSPDPEDPIQILPYDQLKDTRVQVSFKEITSSTDPVQDDEK